LLELTPQAEGGAEGMHGSRRNYTANLISIVFRDQITEIEADFDRYWRGVGVDWRPQKPVAKAIIRPSASPE
jgi:hypothetical protein